MSSRHARAALAALLLAGPAAAQERWVVAADTVYTAAGEAIEDGVVVVEGGKIVAVGTGGSGDRLEAAAVTPGLIDLSARIDTREFSVEQSTETSLTTAVDASLDLFSHRWRRQLEGGVTTVLAAPYDMNVFGGFCTVLKTGGAPTLEAREVRPRAALRASMGTQPSDGNYPPRGQPPTDFYARRPNTRMGVEWVFRKVYYDALNAERFGLEVDEEQARQNAVVLETLRDGLPVVVQAPATQDVRTAIYLKEEFGIQNVVLDAAAEAWKELELVRRSGVGVVLPPLPKDGRVQDPFVPDTYFVALDAAARLVELGVPVALSAHGGAGEGQRLAHQAGFAMRGGLPFEEALAAVTIQPARMLGVDDRVGSIEVGKDADLVLWSGTPFEPTSRIVGVLLDGVLVVDRRAPSQDD